VRARAEGALVTVRGLLSRVRGMVDEVRVGLGHPRAGGHAPAPTGDGEPASDHDHAAQAGPAHADPERARERSPAPRPSVRKIASVAEYFATLDQRFQPAAARGLDAVFQWEISGDGGATYHAVIKDGTMRLTEGRHPEPTVTVAIPAATYLEVINGEINDARAFTTGPGKVSGKLRLAAKMRSLFPVG
jgi:putative sterol carrier protein